MLADEQTRKLEESTNNDEVANGHAQGSDNEDRFAAKLIDIHDGWNRGDEHHNTHDTSGQK